MFNLLRRSKKKKQQKSKSPKAARYSAAANASATASASTPHRVITSGESSACGANLERYRAFGEWEYVENDERQLQPCAALPDVLIGRQPHRRAIIAELEDLNDLDDCDADGDGDADEDGTVAAESGRIKRQVASTTAANNASGVYFRRGQVERAAENVENVNLAKTTAANRSKATNSKYSYSYSPSCDEGDDYDYSESHNASNGNNGDGDGNTNSAINTNNKIFAFGKYNVDKIDGAGVVATAAGNEDGSRGGERYDARPAGGSTVHSASQNEEAVWQGRVLPFARRKKKYIIDRFSKRSNDCVSKVIESNQFNCEETAKTAIDAEDADRIVAATATRGAIRENRYVNTDSNNSNNSNSSSNNNSHGSDTQQQRRITATAADSGTTQTVINEVKYRNLGNTHTSKTQKNSEAKRQSRLSLTLGLNLTSGKSKSVVDVSSAARSDSSSGSAFERVGSGSGGYLKRSTFGKAFRNSFLRGRSASTENEPPDNVPEPTSRSASAAAATRESATTRTTGALQKSKEFFSDIFMARGRNHNRNRNHHTQQQPHSTQQQQSVHLSNSSSSSSSSASGSSNKLQSSPRATCLNAAPVIATSDIKNHNNDNSCGAGSGNNNNESVMHNGNNVGNNGITQHLETISDPSLRDTSRTNSYQITMSNNSPKNAEHEERSSRSNSAEAYLWTNGHSGEGGYGNTGAHVRSRSADTQSAYNAGARDEKVVAPRRAVSVEQQERADGASRCALLPLNTFGRDERCVIREKNVELNGIKTAETANNAVEDRHHDRNDQTQRNNNRGSNNSSSENLIEKCLKENAPRVQNVNIAAADEATANAEQQCLHDELTDCQYTDNLSQSAVPIITTSTATSCTLNGEEVCDASDTRDTVIALDPLISLSSTTDQTPPQTPPRSPSPTPSLSSSMGQTAAKCEPTNSRASTPRDFRESFIPEARENSCDASANVETKVITVPTITVVDCSGDAGDKTVDGVACPVEQEVYYDFENEPPERERERKLRAGVQITAFDDEPAVDVDIENVDDDDDDEADDVFHEQEIPATVYQHNNKWPTNTSIRYNHTKLENVPEQEEDIDDDAIADADADADEFDDEDEDDGVRCGDDDHNLDTEFEVNHFDNFDSPERNPLKSTNTSDSNLSNSFPDSGIGIDSQCSSSASASAATAMHLHGRHSHDSRDNETSPVTVTAAATPTSTASGAARRSHSHSRSRSPVPPVQSQQQQPQHLQQQQRLPFVRDGNSTDCDETLLQCDDLDYVAEVLLDAHPHAGLQPNERLVCIESISLPDVVVESTTAAAGANSISASSATAPATGDQQIININGATGNCMGNVHFIPIHVEGGGDSGGNGSSSGQQRSSPKQWRSIDDSVLGSGGNAKSFNHMNGAHTRATITEITEDASEVNCAKVQNGYHHTDDPLAEKLKLELLEEKSRHNAQLNDAQKNVQNLQNKVSEMQTKIEKLEQELSSKAWNVERLQNELNAAQKDDDCVRRRLKILETEKTDLRHKYHENEEEFKRKYEQLEMQYKELEERYEQTKLLASNLQTQLAKAQSEAEEWRKEVNQIRKELEEQTQVLKNALENSEAERKICQDKWQKEFEMLRTQNMDREETLMTDCEWQMRQMQRQCKDRIDKAVQERKAATERAEQLEGELVERQKQVDDLKVYQAEVKSLRGVVTEQEQAIRTLMEQIDNMKGELQTTNASLEEQMKAVKKIKLQCDNALCDKEREVVYRIHEVRNQAAVFWEDKLYTEMTRLKNELESVYVDERREALDKLQAEHIEELRALTTRYTANEDELRTEYNELQERFERKSIEFHELRDKSDNALLQIRMHLDRADREYQNAMCREEERREVLEEKLRSEFATEKAEMEEKFRERLRHVKEEFAKELQHTTQEMLQQQRKELEKQKAKLQAEREEALQELAERHRKKLALAEEHIKEIELRHQHDLEDLKATYDGEKSAMDRRDISNSSEIEQLHRKCRCLTNLFEEMRMRYERRDPRPEDLREISELRSRCESQERDLFELTDRLREMQMQMSTMQANGVGDMSAEALKKLGKPVKKPPPKTIPTNCDVIYEENEERESPPPTTATPPPTTTTTTTTTTNNKQQSVAEENDEEDEDEDEDEDEEEEDEEDDESDESDDDDEQQPVKKPTQLILNGKILLNGNAKELSKKIDTINEDDDESHMITAV